MLQEQVGVLVTPAASGSRGCLVVRRGSRAPPGRLAGVDRRQQQEGIPIAFNYDALALFSDALNDTSRIACELIK
jgi:hypothetical protein